jgi:hypothetical protein
MPLRTLASGNWLRSVLDWMASGVRTYTNKPTTHVDMEYSISERNSCSSWGDPAESTSVDREGFGLSRSEHSEQTLTLPIASLDNGRVQMDCSGVESC